MHLFAFIYPFIATIKCIEAGTTKKDDDLDHTDWLMYWGKWNGTTAHTYNTAAVAAITPAVAKTAVAAAAAVVADVAVAAATATAAVVAAVAQFSSRVDRYVITVER